MKMVLRLIRLCAALARELSDESAYARHLESIGKPHSSAEWQRFIDLRHRRKYRNAKCC